VTGRLIVHTRHAMIEIPLTGDARADAILERFARLGGGAVLREGGELALAAEDPEREAAA
jgi:hypothetical protein